MYGARGLSQYQAFSKVQVNHSLEVILGSRFKEEGGQAGSDSLAELCGLISEVMIHDRCNVCPIHKVGLQLHLVREREDWEVLFRTTHTALLENYQEYCLEPS